MKRLFAFAGFALLLLTAGGACAQSLGDLQLYENMHTITLQERTLEGVDEQIISYVVQLAQQENMIPEGKTASDMTEVVKAAFETRLDDFCEKYNGTFDACPQTYQMFRDWGMDIIDTRTLSTDLLHIAAGYETGVIGNMGEIFTIAERTLTIRNLWRSADDALLTPEVFPLIRAVPRPDSVTDGMFDAVSEALGREQASAGSVNRYRYGIAVFDREPCRESQGPNELFEATEARNCTLERALTAIRNALPQDPLTFDPPLARGEIVIFPLRILETPPNVIVWMMVENVNSEIRRDVGLGWQLMLETVPIGILGGDNCDPGKMGESYCTVFDRFLIRPGGRYEDPPREPTEQEGGLCHLPFARDGYLCRPMRHDRCNADIEDKEPDSIVLTECKPAQAKQPVALTESGPDICRTSWWRIPSEELKNMSPPSADQDGPLPLGDCALCRLDVRCKDDCMDGASAVTEPKDDNGVIHICINRSAPRAVLRTNLIHELVHTQQLCNLPPHTKIFDTVERCCASEMEANTVSCRVLAEDGVLDEAGVSIEECTGGLANISCKNYGEKPCSDLSAADVKDKIEEVLNRKEREPGSNFPSCDEVSAEWMKGIAKLDARIISMIEGLNGACSPGCQTKYQNTIGNNLCYIGQCVEQSIEQSRVIPGRMALNVGDESFPWDSCAATDSLTGGLITLPAVSPPLTPAYNPRLLVESLDRALCQLNGLPAMTPPILCQFDYERRLSIPTSDYVSTALSFASQIEENDTPTASLQRMTQGMGTRIGTSLLTRYLSWASMALSDSLRAGNQLLNAMENTKFPLSTCPRTATEKPDFCTASSSSD